MTKDEDEERNLIRSCLVSVKEGLTISQLQADFADLVGRPIKFDSFGFSRIEDYLRSIPETVQISGHGKGAMCRFVPNQATKDIASLVARQRSSSKKSSAGRKYTSNQRKFIRPLAPRYPALVKPQTSRIPFRGIPPQRLPLLPSYRAQRLPLLPSYRTQRYSSHVENYRLAYCQFSAVYMPHVRTNFYHGDYNLSKYNPTTRYNAPAKLPANTTVRAAPSDKFVNVNEHYKVDFSYHRQTSQAAEEQRCHSSNSSADLCDVTRTYEDSELSLAELVSKLRLKVQPEFNIEEIKESKNVKKYISTLKINDNCFYSYPVISKTPEGAKKIVEQKARQYLLKNMKKMLLLRAKSTESDQIIRASSRDRIIHYCESVETVEIPEFHLPESTSFSVYVTVIQSGHTLCVQIIDDKYLYSLDEMHDTIKQNYSSLRKINNPNTEIREGVYYLCHLEQDDTWHRVRVKNTHSSTQNDSSTISVLFIDSGLESSVSSDCFYHLDACYATLSSQALNISLQDVRDSAITRTRLKILTSNKSFVFQIDSCTEGVPCGRLYDTVGFDDLEINRLVDDRHDGEAATPTLQLSGSEDTLIHANLIFMDWASGVVYLQPLQSQLFILQSWCAASDQSLSYVDDQTHLCQLTHLPLINEIYLAFNSFLYFGCDSDSTPFLCRVRVDAVNGNRVSVFCIDYGCSSQFCVDELYELPDFLNFRPQVMRVLLHGLPLCGYNYTSAVTESLKQLVVDGRLRVLLRNITYNENQDIYEANIYTRSNDSWLDVNSYLLKNVENFTRIAPSPVESTSEDDTFDVFIVSVASPQEFWIQKTSQRILYTSLQKSLAEFYSSAEYQPCLSFDIAQNGMLALKDCNGTWHRVKVEKCISVRHYLLRYVDIGFTESLLHPSKGRTAYSTVQPLAINFRHIPPCALPSRIADIVPRGGCGQANGDSGGAGDCQVWSSAACEWFETRVLHEAFVARAVPQCKSARVSPAADPLADACSLHLIDTSSIDDVFVHQELVDLGYADFIM